MIDRANMFTLSFSYRPITTSYIYDTCFNAFICFANCNFIITIMEFKDTTPLGNFRVEFPLISQSYDNYKALLYFPLNHQFLCWVSQFHRCCNIGGTC